MSINYTEQIKAGIAYLDKEEGRKEWRERISIQDLNLQECVNCVLGQVYGDFYDVIDYGTLSKQETISLGFDIDISLYDTVREIDAEYVNLTRQWVKMLENYQRNQRIKRG